MIQDQELGDTDAPRLVPHQLERFAEVVEEDFVVRIQQERRGREDGWGPYSRPRSPRSKRSRLGGFAPEVRQDQTNDPSKHEAIESGKPSTSARLEEGRMVLSTMSIAPSWKVRRIARRSPQTHQDGSIRRDGKPHPQSTLHLTNLPRVFKTRVRFAPRLGDEQLAVKMSFPEAATSAEELGSPVSTSRQSPSEAPNSSYSGNLRDVGKRRNPFKHRGTGMANAEVSFPHASPNQQTTFEDFVERAVAASRKASDAIAQSDLLKDLPFSHSSTPNSGSAISISDTERGKAVLSSVFKFPVDEYIEDLDVASCAKSSADLERIAFELFRRLSGRWCRGRVSRSVPQPHLLLRRIYQSLPESSWLEAWMVCMPELLSESTLKASRDGKLFPGLFDTVLDELVYMWHALVRNLGMTSADKGIQHYKGASPFSSLSMSPEMQEVREWSSKSFSERWSRFVPLPIQGSKHATKIESMALLTIAILRRSVPPATSASKTSARAFQEFVIRLAIHSDVVGRIDDYTTVLRPHMLDTKSAMFCQEQLFFIAKHPVLILEEIRQAAAKQAPPNMLEAKTVRRQSEPLDPRGVSLRKRLARALEKRDEVQVNSLWAEAQTAFASPSAADKVEPIPIPVYASFLMAFMALRKPNQANQTWNHMIQSKQNPDLSVWNALLKGAGITKDKDSVVKIWNTLIQCGVRPDAHLWATRMNSLIKSGYWVSAVDSFREMSQLWLKATEAAGHKGDMRTLPDIAEAPKPTVQCVNSLVAGLAYTGRFGELGRVLSWASSLGIQSDAYTFNPLFKAVLLNGDQRLMDKLLSQMRAAGVRPDIATFTVMLDGIFRAGNDEEVADDEEADAAVVEKQAAVVQLLESMRSQGITANAHTFATLIHGLLQSHPPNADAAYAVLKYMQHSRAPMSSQVYTSLIGFHFKSPDPDLAEIDTLWEQARRSSHIALDVVFYDRLIEGFSRLGEIGKASTALSQAGQKSRKPGWTALHEYVQALVQAGERSRAEELVHLIKQEEMEGESSRSSRGRFGFWGLVADYGLDRDADM